MLRLCVICQTQEPSSHWHCPNCGQISSPEDHIKAPEGRTIGTLDYVGYYLCEPVEGPHNTPQPNKDPLLAEWLKRRNS